MHLLCHRWAKEFEDRPSTILQTMHHNPEVNQSSCTSPRPTEFAHSKISGNIMLIVSFEHMASSSCVRTKQTRPVHSAHEDLNKEKKQIGLRRSPAPASRKVCKCTVVGVEKQAARCVKSALSHGDGDKLFSKPLDFELL